MKHLSPHQVIAIHNRIIKSIGGSPGLRDVGLLESAVARPQATFNKADLYSSIFEKAAALMHSLIKNHPFTDGNKRTALVSAGIFLKMNGYSLRNTHEDEVEICLKVAKSQIDIKKLARWIKENSKKTT